MKKVLAVMLVLVMVFALTACNNNSIVGTWEWTVKMTGDMMGIDDFDGKLEMVLIFEFDKDGNYSAYLDEDALEDSFEDFKDDYLEYMVDQYGESYRETLESTFDGLKLDDLMGETKFETEGEYEIDGDTLIMTPDDDDAEEEEFEFELDGDKLTLEGDSKEFEELLEKLGKNKITLKRVK